MLKKSLRYLLPGGAAAAAILSIASATPANPAPAAAVQLTDSFDYVWELKIVEQSAAGWFLDGSVNLLGEVRNANGMLLLSNGAVSMLGDAGGGVPFAYSVKFSGSSGLGIWTNIVGSGAGNGEVKVAVTGAAPPPSVDPGATMLPGYEVE